MTFLKRDGHFIEKTILDTFYLPELRFLRNPSIMKRLLQFASVKILLTRLITISIFIIVNNLRLVKQGFMDLNNKEMDFGGF
jgi:hypothetical protein